MRKRIGLALGGGIITAGCLLEIFGCKAAQAQKQSAATPMPTLRAASKATNTLDLRDAPIRSALELLLFYCDASYSIDPMIGNPQINTVGGFNRTSGERDLTTVRFTNRPFEEALGLLRQSAPSPIALSIEQDKTTPLIYVLRAEKRDALRQASVNEDSEETAGRPGKKEILSYRVCGILRHDEPSADKKAPSTTWSALLARDMPGRPGYALAKVVRTSAWLAGVDGNSPPLRVTGIDAKGVTIQPLGETAYKLPLASVSERAKPVAVKTAIPEIAPAANLPAPIASAPEADRETEETIDTLTLRGASSRSAMELVLQVNNIPYVIDETFPKNARTSVDQSVTRHTREEPFDNTLKMVLRLSSVAITYQSDGAPNAGTLFIAPRPGNDAALIPLSSTANSVPPKYVNERQVPRRVRGLLFHDVYYRGSRQPKTMPYALLETDTPGATAPTSTEIVRPGSQISSPIKGGPPVRVAKIDTEGIWLQAEGDEPFRVLLEPLPKP